MGDGNYIFGFNILKSFVLGIGIYTQYKAIAFHVLCFSIEIHFDTQKDGRKIFSCYNEFR